jgi:chlorinating enzyme
MPRLLSKDAIAAFKRDGYYSPVRIMSAAEAHRYREALQAHEAVAGQPLQGNWRHKTHLLFTWADELVHHPKILDAVEDLIGPDILCWTTNFFIKEAANPGFISWHQDSTYWGLDPHDVITAWVAFTRSDLVSGCMKVIPGTHTADQLPHVDTFHKHNLRCPACSSPARCRCTTSSSCTAPSRTARATGESASPSATSRPT